MRISLYLTLIWLPSALVAFVIVKVLKIGPTVFTISREYGLGVHSGDLYALIPMGIALIVSYVLLTKHSKVVTR